MIYPADSAIHRLNNWGQKDGNAEHVQKKLIESYPVLKECGGFEIIEELQVVKGIVTNASGAD